MGLNIRAKAKVYLINPPITMKEKYHSKTGSVASTSMPLGLYYIASYLRAHNYDILVRDAEARGFFTKDILDEIAEYAPKYVGITCTIVSLSRASEVAAEIRAQNPGIVIVLGGACISAMPEYVMSRGMFDYGVIGEGEITALELFDALLNGLETKNIKGIAYRENEKVVINQDREFIENLDVLPFPAYELMEDPGLYKLAPSNYLASPVRNIISSRGCPFQCTYCSKSVFKNTYRERSASNVFEEIKYVHNKLNIKQIIFNDDTFLMNRDRIHELFDRLKSANIRFDWICQAHISNVDYELLKYVRENGCGNIGFGIESGDEKILKGIRKNLSLARVREVVTWCNQLGIQPRGFFMLGHPGETIASINRTIEFACSVKFFAVNVAFSTPFPGTPQSKEVDKYGIMDGEWSKFSGWYPVFIPKGLTRKLLLEKQKEFYVRYYFRLGIILKYLLSLFYRGGWARAKGMFGLLDYIFS